jgi:hypothetical protein
MQLCQSKDRLLPKLLSCHLSDRMDTKHIQGDVYTFISSSTIFAMCYNTQPYFPALTPQILAAGKLANSTTASLNHGTATPTTYPQQRPHPKPSCSSSSYLFKSLSTIPLTYPATLSATGTPCLIQNPCTHPSLSSTSITGFHPSTTSPTSSTSP